MFKLILLVAAVIFFAMNMGASGIAPAFAASFGGKIIKRKKAVILFGLFVVCGALVLGGKVSATLGKGLLPAGILNSKTALVILVSAGLSLFVSNLLKIPQSTSQVTVAAISGAGIYYQQLNLKALFFKIIPIWIILPALAYILTFLLYWVIYPPRHGNLRLYEKLFTHEKKLKVSALVISCYVAFAIGSNNVANAVGPLFGAGVIGLLPGLLLVAPFFGLGGWWMGEGNLKTAGKKIVPLGIFSSNLVSFVTATLLLVASGMGVPQSLVQLNMFSILAISTLKNGHRDTLGMYVTKKTFLIWVTAPLLATLVSFSLLFLSQKIF